LKTVLPSADFVTVQSMQVNLPRQRLRLRVSAAAESALRSGHPWVWAESCREQSRAGQLGELAVIYDRQDRFLAIGLFDPHAPLRVRVLHTGKPQTIDPAWWRRRLLAAVERRAGRFDALTTGYRLVNGESDGWPGLVLDRYDQTLVLKLYTAAWWPRLDEISANLAAQWPEARIVLRLSRSLQRVAEPGYPFTDGQLLRGPGLEGPVLFRESGLRFEAEVQRGQKTGFFLDQRDNRRIVESLARGRDVLNSFSFSGGFSLYAARGGARSVADLDISAHALASAQSNFALNDDSETVARCPREAIRADAFDWFDQNPARKFDMIILDPPSLARREAERARAIQAYGRLAANAIAHLRPGGILAAASCSAHVSAAEFFAVVRQAARRSERNFEELQTTGHPPDHPATFPEACYLKCIYLRLPPKHRSPGSPRRVATKTLGLNIRRGARGRSQVIKLGS